MTPPPTTATAAATAPRPAVEVTGLRKAYGDTLVLDGLDLTVAEGSVYALLGPNGAGKTTAVRILSTLLPADAGEARVAGHDVGAEAAAVRAAIGVTGQFSAVDDLLTGTENLMLIAELHHLGRREARRRTADLLDRFDLVDAAGRRASTYSGGMKRRLDLAMSLVGDPQVVFLDEPTTGLDPRSRRTMWDMVRELVTRGATIVLTTQYLEEADQLADRIGVLDRGRLVAEGTPAELKRLVPGGHVRLRFGATPDLDRAVAVLADADDRPAGPGAERDLVRDEEALTLQVPGDGGVRSLRTLLTRLDDAAVEVEELSVHTPDLDDVFLALTGRPESEDPESEDPEAEGPETERRETGRTKETVR